MNPILTKNFTASGAILPFRFMKHGASDGVMSQASAATDQLMAISDSLGADDGKRVDGYLMGEAQLLLGGTVTRGNDITSDADGAGVAVTNTVAAATNVNVGAVAMQSGVDGDIIDVLIVQKKIQIRS